MTFSRAVSKFSLQIFVVLPTLVYLGYVLALAQPTFQTEAKLIVRENQSGAGANMPGVAAALLGLGGTTSLEDAMILEDYLHSAEFIELADANLGLRDHFQNAPRDPIRRLGEDAQAETFHRYFRKMVSIRVRPETGIVTVQARAFDPDVAYQLAGFIINRSELVINKLSERMVTAQTALAKRELGNKEQRLLAAREALLTFQIENAVIDPVTESEAGFGNVAALDSRLVEKRTELRAKSSYLREGAFELRVLEQEIAALEAQRSQETGRLVTSQDASMVKTLQAYETLKIEHEFSLAGYTTALATVESATIEAARQEKFLLAIVSPHFPERPVFPRPVRGTLTVFVLACAIFGIGRLVIATIREHNI